MNNGAVKKINAITICIANPVHKSKISGIQINHVRRMKRVYNSQGIQGAIEYAVEVCGASKGEINKALGLLAEKKTLPQIRTALQYG